MPIAFNHPNTTQVSAISRLAKNGRHAWQDSAKAFEDTFYELNTEIKDEKRRDQALKDVNMMAGQLYEQAVREWHKMEARHISLNRNREINKVWLKI